MEKEAPIANEAEVLKGENEVIVASGDGSIGSFDVLVNGTKQTFDTGKKITVSDAQLDVLRNSGRTVEEVTVSKASKGKNSSVGEAGGSEGSQPPAAKAKGKAAAKAPTAKAAAVKEPASNVNNDGNTTTLQAVKADDGTAG